MKVMERREQVQQFRLSFNCLRPGHQSKDCKSRSCSVNNCAIQHKNQLHREISQKEARTGVSAAKTAVASTIRQGGFTVVRMKLVNGNHSLSVPALCYTGSSKSVMDKSLVVPCSCIPEKRLCPKCDLVAGVHGSQDVKTEIELTAASASENS